MAVAQIGALITFVSGTTAVAADVNTNFTDIRNAFNNLVTGANAIGVDTIAEVSAAAGVTVDGVLLKDSLVGPTYGGTGASDPTAKGALIAQGSNPMTIVAPGALNNVLLSDGTDWTSGPQAGPAGNVALLDAANVFTATPQTVSNATDPTVSLTDTVVTVKMAINTAGTEAQIGTTSNHGLAVLTNNVVRWNVQATGHLVPETSDAMDLGSATAGVRHLYLTQQITVDGGFGFAATVQFGAGNDLELGMTTNHGVHLLTNDARRWGWTNAGHYLPSTDVTYDIGSAARNVRDLFTSRVVFNRVDKGVFAAASTFTPEAGTTINVASFTGSSVNIADPSGTPVTGQLLILEVDSGGTGTTITWSGSLWLTVTTNPTIGANKNGTLVFFYNGTNWVQMSELTSIG